MKTTVRIKKLWSLVGKYKEMIAYLFFGGLSFVLNLVLYHCMVNLLFINVLLSNILAWSISTLFSYITNYLWVFEAKRRGKLELFKQLTSFFGGRIGTLLMEEGMLFLFVEILHLPNMVIKTIAQVLVILVNYIISKYWIFKNEEK